MGDNMIKLSGMPFKQDDKWESGSIESVIIKRLKEDSVVYSYHSIEELSFELKIRKNIILSARAMNESEAKFQIFTNSRCNPYYWQLTNAGGFQLKSNIKPYDAIQDIYKNSSLYAFECATACMIIYYHAVLNSIGEYLFNYLFQKLYLYSWHSDLDLGIHTFYGNHYIPGDVLYFNNPEYNPRTPWFRGLNTVDLGDGTYFGHGFGIWTAEEMIKLLNTKRKPESNKSAYLRDLITRPSFKHLAGYSMQQRGYTTNKYQHIVIHHNKSSISYERYLSCLNKGYNYMNNFNPFL